MLESITVITLLLSALIVWSMNRKVASSAFRLASRGMGRSKKKVALSNSLAYSRHQQDFQVVPCSSCCTPLLSVFQFDQLLCLDSHASGR
jgi:hypothetical protein